MKKYFTKKSIISLAIVMLLVVPMVVGAQNSLGLDDITNTSLGEAELQPAVMQIINVLLGFLATIAIVIVLLGGFKWMTAGGNEDKVGEAKKILGAGVIGLVIILAAYAITVFVVGQIYTATGGITGGTGALGSPCTANADCSSNSCINSVCE